MKISNALFSGLLSLGLLLSASPLPAQETPSRALELARQLNEAFIEVAEKVSPSVVVIEVEQKRSTGSEGGNRLFDMFPEDLRRYLERHHSSEDPGPQPPLQGHGSGVLISEDGYILTNHHVVKDADSIEVRLNTRKKYPATVVGIDPESDLAVLKIDATGLTAAKLGDSAKTRVGEMVLAIGAPFQFDYSVTFGHVSAKGRSIGAFSRGGYADQDFIQTDASINPGNSGGPLVNLYGEVVGINTMIRGINTGIGFAIPSNLAKVVADRLMTDGKFVRSYIGVNISDLRGNHAYEDWRLEIEDGVVIERILDGRPAANSKLKAGDIVIAVDGVSVNTSRQLQEQISSKPAEQTVMLDVVRPSKPDSRPERLKVRVKTEALPDTGILAARSRSYQPETASSFGITVQPLTRELAKQYDADPGEGLLVTDVARGSAAADAGIAPGDIITEVNRKPASTLREFREALKSADGKRGVIINLVTEGASRFVVLKEKE